MSSAARRLVQYRFWLEALLERPQPTEKWEMDVFITETRLRDQAAFIIGWGC